MHSCLRYNNKPPEHSQEEAKPKELKQILNEFYAIIEEINSPGTLEGGDIMKSRGSVFYWYFIKDQPGRCGPTKEDT